LRLAGKNSGGGSSSIHLPGDGIDLWYRVFIILVFVFIFQVLAFIFQMFVFIFQVMVFILGTDG